MKNVIPYLIVKGASNAIAFYTKAFGAKETFRMENEGRIGHAEMTFGESKIMLADEHPELGYLGPQGRSPVTLVINTDNCDAIFAQAVAAGAKVEREPKDQEYGERNAGVIDPFGHTWYFSQHLG